jgi:Family of unknown function (DUF6221)
VHADNASKRALLVELERNIAYWSSDDHTRAAAEMAVEAARRCLAEPYAGHADFDPAWRIDG